jgi:indole-3-glycerol phosphate synthase
MSESILDTIIATKRKHIAACQRATSLETLKEHVKHAAPRRGFTAALQAADTRPALIAEIKHQSPSQGVLRANFDAADIAEHYQQAGAHTLSVLTDTPYFGGDLAYIQQAKARVALPILRKDFILEPYQVYESAVAGADAILLIVAILDQDMLFALHHLARSLALDVLVEVHSEDELTQALGVHAELIGVNHRDLHTFAIDLGLSERLRPYIPTGALMVAESGLRTTQDIKMMRMADVHAVLIGEAFMVQSDIVSTVRSLMGW